MIEKFNIPKHLRTVSNDGSLIDDKHVFRVFRDREELSTKDLSTMIEEAIANSENLIVICSKRTSLSPWCRKEVQLFKKFMEQIILFLYSLKENLMSLLLMN